MPRWMLFVVAVLYGTAILTAWCAICYRLFSGAWPWEDDT